MPPILHRPPPQRMSPRGRLVHSSPVHMLAHICPPHTCRHQGHGQGRGTFPTCLSWGAGSSWPVEVGGLALWTLVPRKWGN